MKDICNYRDNLKLVNLTVVNKLIWFEISNWWSMLCACMNWIIWCLQEFCGGRKSLVSFWKFLLKKGMVLMSMSTAFSGVYCDQGSDGDEDDSSIETNEASVLNAVGLSVVYNKTRELYFLNCEMFCKQLDKRVVATCPVQVESKPTSCFWCCQNTHDQPDPNYLPSSGVQCASWSAFATWSVSMGRAVMNCWLFHTTRSSSLILDYYCKAKMDAMVHVVCHQKRPAPPIWGRPNADDSSQEEEPAWRVWSQSYSCDDLTSLEIAKELNSSPKHGSFLALVNIIV